MSCIVMLLNTFIEKNKCNTLSICTSAFINESSYIYRPTMNRCGPYHVLFHESLLTEGFMASPDSMATHTSTK